MEFTNPLNFLAGVLYITSILATAITPRLGVPLLLPRVADLIVACAKQRVRLRVPL